MANENFSSIFYLFRDKLELIDSGECRDFLVESSQLWVHHELDGYVLELLVLLHNMGATYSEDLPTCKSSAALLICPN